METQDENFKESLKQVEVTKVVEHIGDYLSEVTSQVLWLMDAIPDFGDESLDKLEEKLTNEWGDSPIFEDVRDRIIAAINSYRQDKILKELDEKFKQLKKLELDYMALDKNCEILFDKLTDENFRALDTYKYYSRFVDEIHDCYRCETSR